ncbi:MAG: glycosyltransferase family 39 protein [Anaerolineae bacterium]|nr:glycosyltransferase family 39 protein [Anaerolineae bacterium]
MPNEKPSSAPRLSLSVLFGMALMSVALVVGYALGRSRLAPADDPLPPPEPQALALPQPTHAPRLPAIRRKLFPTITIPQTPQTQRLGLITGVVALGSFALAGWNFRWQPYTVWTTPFDALNWTFLGVGLAVICLLCLRPRFTEFAVVHSPVQAVPINWVFIGLSLIALFLITKVNSIPLSDHTQIQQNMQLDTSLQFWLLILASGGLLVGLGGILPITFRSLIAFESNKPSRGEIVALGVVELCIPVLAPVLFGKAIPPLLSVILILAGAASILYGARFVVKGGNVPTPRPNLRALASRYVTPHALGLSLIIGIGFILRVWQVDTAVHVTVDEMHFWTGVLTLRSSPTMHLLMPIDYIASFTHIYAYLQQLAVSIFGPDLFAMRFPSVIFGTLTIPAIYFLTREGLDKKTALIAAGLLAVFPPHIHFSRTALNNIADPLLGTLALAFLVRGMKHNSQRAYVLAGVCFGWTCFFYEGGRLLFVGLFVAYLAYMLVTQRPWGHLRNWLLMGVCAVLLFAPYYYSMSNVGYSTAMRLIDRGSPELERYRQTYEETNSIGAVLLQYYDNGLKPPFYHIVYSPDSSKLYYGGQTSLLQWFLVPLFLFGVCLGLIVFHRFGALLLIWIVLTGVGASIVPGSDWTARVVVYFVPIIGLLAMGLRYPFELLLETRLRLESVPQPQVDRTALLATSRTILYALIAAAIVYAGAYQIQYYFTSHLLTYNREVRQYRYDFLDAFYRALEADPGGHLVYVVSGQPDHPSLEAEEVKMWIDFKQVPMTFEVVNIAELTSEKAAVLAEAYKDRTIIFAIEPAEVSTDNFGNPLESPQTIPVNQQAHDAIVSTFPNTLEQNNSPYPSVPSFQQYQLLIAPRRG